MHNETDNEQYQEKYLGDTDCSCRYSHETKDARDDGNDKKYYGPVKHMSLLLHPVPLMSANPGTQDLR
jgi:hypothetical protein